MNLVFTPETILAAEAGDYDFLELFVGNTVPTVVFAYGATQALTGGTPGTFVGPVIATVSVSGDSQETHNVIFGNVGPGSIEACKVYDLNVTGEAEWVSVEGLIQEAIVVWQGDDTAEMDRLKTIHDEFNNIDAVGIVFAPTLVFP